MSAHLQEIVQEFAALLRLRARHEKLVENVGHLENRNILLTGDIFDLKNLVNDLEKRVSNLEKDLNI